MKAKTSPKLKPPASRKAASPLRLTRKQKIEKEFRARNRAFKKADPATRRVMVAQDVIAQLKAEKFQAGAGNWLTTIREGESNWPFQVLPKISSRVQYHEVMERPGVSCKVCAL